MNAPARSIEPARSSGRAEHISIEASADVETPARQPHRRTLSTYTLRSRLRGRSTEVRILQDHFLAVTYERSGEPPRKFTFDLRFANPRPERVRRTAWVCLGTAVTLALATAAGFIWAKLSAATLWTHPGFLGGAVGAVATIAMLFLFLRRTTESLQFTSVHGNAVLVKLVGGIGAAKSGKDFVIELIKNISAAKQVRAQPQQQFLRDEMREHHRLRELNILTQEEYEASKARILSQHR